MIEIYWINQLNSGLWWWTLKQSLGPLPGETGPSDATISWRIFFFRLAGVDLRVMEGSSRNAARSLFWGRSQGLVFLAENKRFPTEEKVCFNRCKRFFSRGRTCSDQERKPRISQTEVFDVQKKLFCAKRLMSGLKTKPFGKRLFQTPQLETNSNTASFKSLKEPHITRGERDPPKHPRHGENWGSICKYM